MSQPKEQTKETKDTKDVDEGLYSRQLYVFGKEAMKSMGASRVLISGLGGLGVEIAKNIILSGVKSVMLHDTHNTVLSDLSTQFYLTEADIGKNRATACKDRLAELNSYVEVAATTAPTSSMTEEFLSKFNVIIMTDTPMDELIRINNITHNKNIAFISTVTKGLCGQIFCDFGDSFTVHDTDGEQPLHAIIERVTNEKKAIITCIETKPHGLISGDLVKFNTSNMPELNECKEAKIEYIDKISFRVDIDTSGANKFERGEFVQVKPPKVVAFKRLTESIKAPEFVITSFVDFDRPNTLHACYQAYHEGEREGKRGDQKFEAFYSKVKKYHEKADEGVAEKFFFGLKGELAPMNSFIGGIAAQEALKAASGKFTPIMQWLYFDSFTCLPENYKTLNTTPTSTSTSTPTSQGSRYDKQIAVFGHNFQKKLESLKYMIVGAGAIGCELLKNFALVGVGCGSGKVYVTDMDTIERSNLNRQFLFRNSDIGKPKSEAAAAAVKRMNPNINIEAHLNRVGQETESFYNRAFFNNLDGVANALDNVAARLYVDSRCVLFGKSLLESGTLGTKGNVQVVVPRLTESYGSSQDPPEQSVPVCTIKNFPNAIEHCIQFAREQFEGNFDQNFANVVKYMNDPEKVKGLPISDLLTVVNSIKTVVDNIPTGFEDCIAFAFGAWHVSYRDQIEQLLHNFPADHMTSSGVPFWSAAKKCPTPLKFDANSQEHLDFIMATANLWANCFNLKLSPSHTREFVKKHVATLPVPKFTINKNAQASATDEEEKKKQQAAVDTSDIETLKKSLPDLTLLKKLTLAPQAFEKDSDTNFHIDFITAASNLRALNYSIPTADRLKTKGIAGKIIPALATTTSVVSGLVMLEFYKLVQGFEDVERYNNTFVNLALPFFGLSEPIKAKALTYKEHKFTMWDSFELKGDRTLQEVIDYFQDKHNFELDFINYGSFMLYSHLIPPAKLVKRYGMKIRDIIEQELNTKVVMNMISLTIGVPEEEDGKEVDLPPVQLLFE